MNEKKIKQNESSAKNKLLDLLSFNAMNQKGNVILYIIIAFAIIAILPPIFISIFPPAKYIFAIIIVFTIWGTVRMFLGDGALTWIISAVLIYLIVIQHLMLASSIFTLQMVLMLGVTSVIVWGIARTIGG